MELCVLEMKQSFDDLLARHLFSSIGVDLKNKEQFCVEPCLGNQESGYHASQLFFSCITTYINCEVIYKR